MIEAFSIGVKISLINRVSSELLLLGKQFTKVHGDATKLQGALDSLRFRGLAGGALLGLGGFGLLALRPALQEAKKLQEAQAKFATFGMGAAANAEAFRFAQGMNVAGSSYVDNMKRMIEAQGVFRESGAQLQAL